MSVEKIPKIKLTIIGDGMVGKTCLLTTYTTNKFLKKYEPTIFENYTDIMMVDDKKYEVSLMDTAGKHFYCLFFSSFITI